MKFLFTMVALVIALLAVDAYGQVVEATDQNLLQLAQKARAEGKKGILLEFHAEWCGYCKQTEPMVAAAAVRIPEIIVLKIDADKNPQAAKDVSGLPTLIMISNKGVRERQGLPKGQSELAEWIKGGL